MFGRFEQSLLGVHKSEIWAVNLNLERAAEFLFNESREVRRKIIISEKR